MSSDQSLDTQFTPPRPALTSGSTVADHIGRSCQVLEQVGYGSRSPSMDRMQLLPCIVRDSKRWWLPLTEKSSEAIGQALISFGRGSVGLDSALRCALVAALRDDPPFAIYAAIHCAEGPVSLCDLAQWWYKNAPKCFSRGEAFSDPIVIDQGQIRRWNKLRDHYRLIPIDRWMDDANLWLEAAGPIIDSDWKRCWPNLIDDGGPLSKSNPCTSPMLQQLARAMERQRSLQDSFDQKLHASKLGSLKQLAYGLSHEINNPLANISTRAQQLQRDESDESRQATLQRIVDQVYRAHEMIADMMFYANPPEPEKAETDLATVIQEITGQFDGEAHRLRIQLGTRLPDAATVLNLDSTMFGEAIRVLIRNSIEAIGCDGAIEVSVFDDENCWRIQVADSGPGLSDQAREHAFDPYFSGREAGRGLGLGLCRAYRIIKLHDGDITLGGGPIGCVATISLSK